MEWYEKMRAKRWNERVRLVITFLNVTAIGAFGLAVTGPIVTQLNLRGGTENTAGGARFSEVTLSSEFSLSQVVAWDIALAALVVHAFAHILVTFIEPEE